MKPTHSLFVLILILCSNFLTAQEYGPHSIKLSFGTGMSANRTGEGPGLQYGFGYQRELGNPRLRYNLQFTIGHYSSKWLMDAPDCYFNARSLGNNVFFDVLSGRTSAVVIGAGLVLNNSRGLQGTGGMDAPDNQQSEYFNNYSIGGTGMLGIRLYFANKRHVLNILPINLTLGSNYFFEFHPKLEFDFRF